jgi:ABC-type spermidine/putrescine transport system permease subunit I
VDAALAEDLHVVTVSATKATQETMATQGTQATQATQAGRSRAGWWLAAPILAYSLLLFVVPAVSVLRTSLSTSAGPVAKGLTLRNYGDFLTNELYWRALVNTVVVAVATVVITALLALPYAYALATRPGLRNVQLALLFAPLLVNGVVRVFGLQMLLAAINKALLAIGLIHHQLPLLYSYYGIVIALVVFLFPYMAMAIYASVSRIDETHLEAARTLGASRSKVLWHVAIPHARGGMVAGSVLVFAGAAGSYIIPAMMGGGQILTVPQLVFNSVSQDSDWGMAGALAVVLVLLLLPVLAYSSRRSLRTEADR